MKYKINYKNINNLYSLLKFFYYVTIFLAFISIIITIATPLLPDANITFEKGIREWFYSIVLPTGIGSSSFTSSHNISKNILHLVPIRMINIKAAIILDSLINLVFLILLVNIGLKKLVVLTKNILNNESPFQLKHIKSLRQFSLIIILYSTLKSTILGILFSIFVIDSINITLDFMWSGIFIGILGYIFSDITEYGLFLQDEYDTTL